MIGELKDIWIVFKKAYNEHFALKLKALDAIKEYETKMNSVCKVHYLLDEINDNLDEVYSLLPIKENQDSIKSTLKHTLFIFHHAAKVDEGNKEENPFLGSFLGYGLKDIYSNLYRILEHDYKEIKKLYKEKKYDDAIKLAEKMLKYLDNFCLVYC